MCRRNGCRPRGEAERDVGARPELPDDDSGDRRSSERERGEKDRPAGPSALRFWVFVPDFDPRIL